MPTPRTPTQPTATADPALEWHTLLDHRVSLEPRTDRAKFTVMSPLSASSLRLGGLQLGSRRQRVATGVVHGNGYPAAEPYLALDRPEHTRLELGLQVLILECWKRLALRLMEAQGHG